MACLNQSSLIARGLSRSERSALRRGWTGRGGVLAVLAWSMLVLVVGAEESLFPRRVPAPFMSYRGAPWLERPEREKEERPEAVIERMGLRPGDVVADIGCGSGYFARRIGRAVGPEGKVYGVDIQPEMIEMLKRGVAEAGLGNVVPVLSREDDPLLPKGEIDWMILADVFHEFSEPEAMLARMREALAPEGRVALVEYRVEDGTGDHIKPDHRMSVRQVLAEWKPAGFELVALDEFLPHQHLFILRAAADGATPPLADHDLVSGLDGRLIEVEGTQADGGAVELRLRRLTAHPVIVTSSVGTMFVAEEPALNRVARRDGSILLDDEEWRTWRILSIGVAIGSGAEGPVGFSIRPPQERPALARLMWTLQWSGLPVEVERAAVWIAEADASLADLRPFLAAGPVRNGHAVGLALAYLDRAGLNLRDRRIWADLPAILEDVREPELRAWLEGRQAR